MTTGQTLEFVPDNEARLGAIKVVTAYSEGLPVQRQINTTAGFRSLADKREVAMLSSPLLDKALDEFGDE